MNGLPSGFIKNITEIHGSDGQKWLEELPSHIRTVEQRWNINVFPPFDSLTHHYVALVKMQDGTKAILKMGIPGDATNQEAKCLQLFEGNGAVRLLNYSRELGAMLIERIIPGYNIRQLDEQQAVKACASVIQNLHRPFKEGSEFPTVHDWGKSFKRLRDYFDGSSGPLPSGLVDEGEKVFTNLADTMDAPVLLHGDLHHGNILAGSRYPWLAIDPKGIIGEPEYEIGAFLRNPMPALSKQDHLESLMARRIDLFSDITGYDRERIAGWGFSQAVLSAIWSLEDHDAGWENMLKVARAIQLSYSN